jgi:hypothetical protein
MKLIFISLALASSGYLALCVIRALLAGIAPEPTASGEEKTNGHTQVDSQDGHWERVQARRRRERMHAFPKENTF